MYCIVKREPVASVEVFVVTTTIKLSLKVYQFPLATKFFVFVLELIEVP